MPRCSRCEENLPEADFNASSVTTSGLQSRCKRCSREGSRETQRRLRQDPSYRKAEVQRERALYQIDPEFRRRKRARSHARHALDKGQINQMPCACGCPESQMHIEDYDRPLAVTWVCEACRRLHDHGPDREGEDPIGALLRRFDQRREGPSTLRKTQGRPRRVA